eukprot:scaffold62_cov256-Pinguiococcus_pyrenoidosus.AAC.19
MGCRLEAVRIGRMLQGWIAGYLHWYLLGMPLGSYASYKDRVHAAGLQQQPGLRLGSRLSRSSAISYDDLISYEGRHAVFFCVCQALLYIMCFRIKDFAEARRVPDGDSSEDDLLGESFWRSLINSRLCPLKNCLESVRKEFVYLCARFDILPQEIVRQLLQAYPLDPVELTESDVETDEEVSSKGTAEDRKDQDDDVQRRSYKRPRDPAADCDGGGKKEDGPRKKQAVRIGVGLSFGDKIARRIHAGLARARPRKGQGEKGTGGLGGGLNPLDSFFPFDPFLLERSHRFIEKDYTYWDALSETPEEDEGEEDDRDDDREEDGGKAGEEEGEEGEEDDDDAHHGVAEDSEDDDEEEEQHSAAGEHRVSGKEDTDELRESQEKGAAMPRFREHKSRANSVASEEDIYVQHEDVPVEPGVAWTAGLQEGLPEAGMYRRPRNYSIASSNGEGF